MSATDLPPPLNQLDSRDTVRRTLLSGEVLFTQNDPTTGLFYLVSGTVDLKRTTRTGHSIMIHRARSADTFAEASLFSDKYHCTATAAIDTTIIQCKRSSVTQLLNNDIEFTRTMAFRFASQIQESWRRVELLSIRAPDERILAALSDGLLAEEISVFAETIGLAPETVYRTLSLLTQRKRILKTARGEYQVLTQLKP